MSAPVCLVLREKDLERYLTSRLPAQMMGNIYDDSIAQVEDHLMLCPVCLAKAELHELITKALRQNLSSGRALAARQDQCV